MGKFMPAISENLALGWVFLGYTGLPRKCDKFKQGDETLPAEWVCSMEKILQTFSASNHRFRIVLEGQQACQCRCQACMPLPFGTGGVVWPSRGRLVKFLPSIFQISGTAIAVFSKGHERHIIFCGRGSGSSSGLDSRQFQWPSTKFSRRSWNLWPWLACSFEGAVALLPSSLLAGSSRLMLSDSLPDYWIGYQEPQ